MGEASTWIVEKILQKHLHCFLCSRNIIRTFTLCLRLRYRKFQVPKTWNVWRLMGFSFTIKHNVVSICMWASPTLELHFSLPGSEVFTKCQSKVCASCRRKKNKQNHKQCTMLMLPRKHFRMALLPALTWRSYVQKKLEDLFQRHEGCQLRVF